MDGIIQMSTYRIAGELKKLSGDSIPLNWLFFDTETYTEENMETQKIMFPFRLGVAIYLQLNPDMSVKNRKVLKFYKPLDFMEFIMSHLRKKTVLYIVAHNITFDLRVLDFFNMLNSRGVITQPPAFKERLFMWDISTDKGKMLFLDTSQFGVLSVEKLGSDMGFEKMSVDFNNVTDNELMTYCIRDVEILEHFMLQYLSFINDNNLGGFKPTLASQSLSAYRTRFMNKPPFLHKYNDATKLERDSYFGGRTECFYIGQLPPTNDYYYSLDVNSMYPYAMSNYKLPQRIIRYAEDTTPKFLAYHLNKPNQYIVADVEIDTEHNLYPIVYNGRLIFPIGRFRANLHDAELRYAMQHNSILRVYRIAIYHADYLFKDYVKFFYDEKTKHTQSGNYTRRMIAKLFLNSLYGKFGQLQVHRKKVGVSNENIIERVTGLNIETNARFSELNWYGDIWREERHGETSFSFPALAGSITSIARFRLYELIMIAGKENVFYTDTDSLIVNKTGYDRLAAEIDNEELGKLKLEKTGRDVYIYGNKDYRFERIEKIKGITKSAERIDENTWRVKQFQGFITYLNNGGVDPMQAKVIVKGRRTSYRKGIVNENGYVTPYRF